MRKGFTFIELLLIVGLIMMIGTSTNIFYSRFMMQNAVSDTTDLLVGTVRKAQLYSMSGRHDGGWGVAVHAGELTLFQGASYDFRDTSADEISTFNDNVSLGDFTGIVFEKTTGLPNISPTITISGGSDTRTVTINNQGIANR